MAISIEVWGDFACFTPPYAKVERLTYPFPTPSACRGILSAIYSKPAEFYWQIDRIEILNPIQYISFKRNEVKTRVNNKVIYTDEERTQRQTVALKDVRYRITASICPRPDFKGRAATIRSGLQKNKKRKMLLPAIPWGKRVHSLFWRKVMEVKSN